MLSTHAHCVEKQTKALFATSSAQLFSQMPPRRKKVPPKQKQKDALAADLARCKAEFKEPPAPPPKQEDLPYGWEICKTKDGKVFYFHTHTSEKRWDPPTTNNHGWNWDPSKEKDGGANSWAAY